MSVESIARRLSREHRELDVLMRRLHECVDYMPRTNEANWIQALQDTFDEFRTHVMRHMDLEESEGYMSEVVERRPPLSEEVERLILEHRAFRLIIDGIRDRVHGLSAEQSLLIRDACHRVRDLLAYVRHHEHDENMLVLSAYTDEIGTKD